jgi:hypothetical protein
LNTIRAARAKLTSLIGVVPQFIYNAVVAQQRNFMFKDGPHLQDTNHKVPDYEFPNSTELSFENHIIGFITNAGGYYGHNFILSNG